MRIKDFADYLVEDKKSRSYRKVTPPAFQGLIERAANIVKFTVLTADRYSNQQIGAGIDELKRSKKLTGKTTTMNIVEVKGGNGRAAQRKRAQALEEFRRRAMKQAIGRTWLDAKESDRVSEDWAGEVPEAKSTA